MLALGIMISLVIIAGIVLLCRWMVSGFSVHRGADSLTPQDLAVLEQSAVQMVDEIKETAAVAIRDLDDRCEELRKLILLADQRIALWSQTVGERTASVEETDTFEPDPAADSETFVYELADAGARPDEIARHTNLPVGEVKLLLGLRSAAKA